MLTLKQGAYYLAMWFVGHDERLPVRQRTDWLCMVWKETPGSAWSLAYRVSYHVSEGLRKDGAPADTSNWYRATVDAATTEEHLLAKIERLATIIAARNQVPLSTVLIQGDYLQAMRLLEPQPWFHTYPAPEEPSHAHTGRYRS